MKEINKLMIYSGYLSYADELSKGAKPLLEKKSTDSDPTNPHDPVINAMLIYIYKFDF